MMIRGFDSRARNSAGVPDGPMPLRCCHELCKYQSTIEQYLHFLFSANWKGIPLSFPVLRPAKAEFHF